MICNDQNMQLLKSYLESYEIDSTDEQRAQLLRHLDLVVDKNRVMNLTRIIDAQDAIIRHAVDSLLFLPAIRAIGLGASGRFVDIGTGAGFPGIPLGIMTQMKGTLVDSVGKKVNAVNEFVEVLSLGSSLEGLAVRAEDLARERYEAYDLVVARAVADLGILVEYASPLLRAHGYLVVSKGQMSEEELGHGTKVAQLAGMRCVSRETYELPLDSGHREILVFERAGKRKVRLPRRVGEAKRNPLYMR